MSEVMENNSSQPERAHSEENSRNRNNRQRRGREIQGSTGGRIRESGSQGSTGGRVRDFESNDERRERFDNNTNNRRKDFNRRDSNRNNSRGSKRSKGPSSGDPPPIVDDGTSYKAKMNRNYHNSIFIGNLPYNCSGEDLTDGFNKFGQVIRSDIVTQKGRHRGMGTVEFRDYSSVTKAIRSMNSETFMGRIIFVRKDNPPPEETYNNNNSVEDEGNSRRNKDDGRRERNNKKTNTSGRVKSKYDEIGEHSMSTIGYEIFAANLPFSTKAQDLFEMFSKFGKVLYAKVIRDKDGRSRGYGVCNMETKEQAMSVLQFCQNLDIEGRKLDCKVGKVGWVAQSVLDNETESSENRSTTTDETYTMLESEATERELIKQREAERSLRDQGTFSFMDDIINGGNGITKVATGTSAEIPQLKESTKEEKIIPEIEPQITESCFILIHNILTDADHNDIVELCQSFGSIITSSRESTNQINKLFEEQKEALKDPESVIVEFENPVTDESCIKVLNGFVYAGKELVVKLYAKK
ncbi:hypothetical protein QEN19_003391 [Hanseniaspora menglaensis]